MVFFLNGNRKPADGLSTEFSGLARGTYFLRASILDGRTASPVITSQQTTFHVRQPSINSPQSPTGAAAAEAAEARHRSPRPKPAGN